MNERHGYMTNGTSVSIDSISEQLFRGFSDEAYRRAYAEEYLNTSVAFQIRTIREQRGWTQVQLGEHCGGKAQAWISKLEDPDYGKFTLTTLRALARAFDCVLEVKFQSFLDHSEEQERRYPGDLRVNTYTEDVRGARLSAAIGEKLMVSGTTARTKMAVAALDGGTQGDLKQQSDINIRMRQASTAIGGYGRGR